MIKCSKTISLDAKNAFSLYKADHFIAEFVSHQSCLEAESRDDSLRLSPCDSNNSFQKWQFTHYNVQV